MNKIKCYWGSTKEFLKKPDVAFISGTTFVGSIFYGVGTQLSGPVATGCAYILSTACLAAATIRTFKKVF